MGFRAVAPKVWLVIALAVCPAGSSVQVRVLPVVAVRLVLPLVIVSSAMWHATW